MNWCILIFDLCMFHMITILVFNIKGAEAVKPKNLTKYFNTLSFTVIFYRYPKTMLLKCFQNCMYSSREKLEMNFTILHTVFCASPWSCLQFQWNWKHLSSAILRQWPDFDSSMAWFWYVWKKKLNKTDSFTILNCWFFFYIYCNFAAAPNILSRQQIFLS